MILTKETYIKIANTDLDRKYCCELINRVFHAMQYVTRKDRDMIPVDQLSQELSGPDKEVYMLCHQLSHQLLSTVVLTLGRKTMANLADIRYLATDLPSQGFGLGKELMGYIELRAKALQKTTMYLTVVDHPDHPQDRLIEWYINQNYVHVEDRQATPIENEKWFAPQYHGHINVYEKMWPILQQKIKRDILYTEYQRMILEHDFKG